MNEVTKACAIMAWFSVLGCAQSEIAQSTEAPLASKNTNKDGHAIKVRSHAQSRQNDRELGPGERRVVVFVVPGDAWVEVDGQTIDRRDGVIELVGKIGDTRRVRAWKGDKSTETKVVAIEDTGANPSFMDVNEMIPAKKDVTGKKNAARFDLSE
jgi:hypothetical protein